MYRLFQERQVYQEFQLCLVNLNDLEHLVCLVCQVYQEFQLYPVNLNGLERQVYQEFQEYLVYQLIQGYH